MKKTLCAVFCLMVVSCIFSVTAFANDFNNRAVSAFQEFRKLNEEWTAAFLSGDSALQKEKGDLLANHKDNEFAYILRSLTKEYCADPQMDVLREFMKTIISTSNSGDEYPTYVFAELFACDPDRVTKEILSLTPEDQKVIVENLDYGFKNITHKIESLPNHKELVEKLDNLKSKIRTNPKK
jgi:hypothetical protein